METSTKIISISILVLIMLVGLVSTIFFFQYTIVDKYEYRELQNSKSNNIDLSTYCNRGKITSIADLYSETIIPGQKIESDFLNMNRFFTYDDISSMDDFSGNLISSKITINKEFDMSISNVLGNSMNPIIPDGSIVITRALYDDYDFRVGDIISIPSPEGEEYSYWVHRIVEINNTHVLTRGDNNYEDDGWTRREDVLEILMGVLY